MSQAPDAPRRFLDPAKPLPFCRGCGHHHYVHHLDEALVRLDLDPASVVLVSDIGCIGMVDAAFVTPHTLHTTHGRSTAFATGLELADDLLHDSALKTIVVIGDGGATIGLLHIVTAAALNADVTVVVGNNFVYGMTGGQQSGLSPLDFVTTTSPAGNIVPPLDICALAREGGAGFVARALATDRDLPDIMARAIAHPGFALVEVVELCTAFATGANRLDGRRLRADLERQHHALGVLVDSCERPGFGVLYRERVLGVDRTTPRDDRIVCRLTHELSAPQAWVLAGTAGEHVQLAGYLLARAAASSGLHCAQRNENPSTQGTGFSVAEVRLSPHEIGYLGVDVPDVVVVASSDGLAELVSSGVWQRSGGDTLVVADESLDLPPTAGRLVRLPLRTTCTPARATLAGVRVALEMTSPFGVGAFDDRIAEHDPRLAAACERDARQVRSRQV